MNQPVDRPEDLPVVAAMTVHGVDDLARARRLVGEAAAGAGLHADRIDRFTIAVSEVVTNAVLHGNGSAIMIITRGDSALMVEVRDRGTGMLTGPRPVLPDPTEISGRGLWLAEHLCDELEIISSTSGTTVRMMMRR
jgi:anti-sigma regulatory factor (Ser/Thr protein kinase)